MRRGVMALEGSPSDLRRHLAGLVNGSMAVDQFHRWFVGASSAIEACGSDDDVDLANLVFSRFAEYTSGYIGEWELIDALCDDVGALPKEAEVRSWPNRRSA